MILRDLWDLGQALHTNYMFPAYPESAASLCEWGGVKERVNTVLPYHRPIGTGSSVVLPGMCDKVRSLFGLPRPYSSVLHKCAMSFPCGPAPIYRQSDGTKTGGKARNTDSKDR